MQNHPQNITFSPTSFGMLLPERTWTSDSASYRYGFNGMEKDIEYNSGAYDFGARIYDGRIGKWLSIDKLNQFHSPYIGIGNSPISSIDIDGNWVVGTDGRPIIVNLHFNNEISFSSNTPLDVILLFTAMSMSHTGFNQMMAMVKSSTRINVVVSNDIGIQLTSTGYRLAMGLTQPNTTVNPFLIKEQSRTYGNEKGLVYAEVTMYFFLGSYQYQMAPSQADADALLTMTSPNITLIDATNLINPVNTNPTPQQISLINGIRQSTSQRDQFSSQSQFLHLVGTHEAEHLKAANIALQLSKKPEKAEIEANNKEDKARRTEGNGQKAVINNPRGN